jgi:hypothetical protein
MLNVYEGFATSKYMVPSKSPRGWWHDNNPLDRIQWRYLPLSKCGAYYDNSEAVGGFATEEEAIAAAKKRLVGE